MPVTSVEKDATALTMTITAQFPAAPARVWQVWADPRQLERWWGPPSHPATVVDHDLAPGGRVSYYMTGPEGEKYQGWWRVLSVDPPGGLEFEDGFADGAGVPDPSMPVTRTTVSLDADGPDGTTMRIVTSFPSAEAMAQLEAMGMAEGMSQALGQIDGLLAQ